MVAVIQLTDKLKSYIATQLDSMSKTTPMVGFMKPLITRAADVYVAINAQYHDYCELFKSWFGDGVEQKIIESAVIFWFKDDDYKDGFKLWNYFKED